MASHLRVPRAELTGIYGAIIKRMSRRMLGDVAEPVEVAWHNRTFIALANLIARFNTAMGVESQEFSATCDLKPLAAPSVTRR